MRCKAAFVFFYLVSVTIYAVWLRVAMIVDSSIAPVALPPIALPPKPPQSVVVLEQPEIPPVKHPPEQKAKDPPRLPSGVASSAVPGTAVSAGEHAAFSSSSQQPANAASSRRKADRRRSRSILEYYGNFSEVIAANSPLFGEHYGRWFSNCSAGVHECLSEILGRLRKEYPVILRGKLESLVNESIHVWNITGGISLDHVTSMIRCTYSSRSHRNPQGVLFHIANRTATPLRILTHAVYKRTENIVSYIRRIVAESRHPLPPVVVYISVTDVPCHPDLPYLTFFSKRGLKNIVIPDDTFTKDVHGRDWEQTREVLRKASANFPLASRVPSVFFVGSPTHSIRDEVQRAAHNCCPNTTNITLAWFAKTAFRGGESTPDPIETMVQYKYLLSIRGRVASYRDKYLFLTNSTVLRIEDETEPWFQFYHALWQPWINYIPVLPIQVESAFQNVTGNEAGETPSFARLLEQVGNNAAEIGNFLTAEVVDDYTRLVLRRYAEVQLFPVEQDALQFFVSFQRFLRWKYRHVSVMPEDERRPYMTPIHRWAHWRIGQLLWCRNHTGRPPGKGVPHAYSC